MRALRVTDAQWHAIDSHLFDEEVEHAAFLYAARANLVVTDIDLIGDDEVVQGLPWHITLSDAVRPRVIKKAWDSDSVLIEAHSHRISGPARFSPTDLDGLAEFVPHVMWRLPGRPYIALVFAEASFDALVWEKRDDPPGALDALVVGDQHRPPTGLTIMHREADDGG